MFEDVCKFIMKNDRLLDCFHFSTVMNKVTVGMNEQVSLQQDVEFFGHMLKRGAAEF